MREIKLKKDSFKKLEKGQLEFYSRDLDQTISQFIPGEWAFIPHFSKDYSYLVCVNPFVDKSPCLRVAGKYKQRDLSQENEPEFIKAQIQNSLQTAIQKRMVFKNQRQGSRLVYGNFDQLPGLIVDMYKDVILIQISSAGMDRFREEIRMIIQNSYKDHKIVFFDNAKKRIVEGLPAFENKDFEALDSIKIVDSGIEYDLSREIIQKNGYYYDHSPNRLKLERAIKQLDLSFKTGVDLFSYCGSWGLHLFRAGLEKVYFVDQSSIVGTIPKSIELNQFKGESECIQSDVFAYLDQCRSEGKKFDVIVSDPPAFSKGKDTKVNALRGYDKIHQKCVGLLNGPGLFAVGSCTKNIDFNDLDQSVKKAFSQHSRKAQMIDLGIQGPDHPFADFLDKGFYIKFILYLVD